MFLARTAERLWVLLGVCGLGHWMSDGSVQVYVIGTSQRPGQATAENF